MSIHKQGVKSTAPTLIIIGKLIIQMMINSSVENWNVLKQDGVCVDDLYLCLSI
jgi:hypothetical protein